MYAKLEELNLTRYLPKAHHLDQYLNFCGRRHASFLNSLNKCQNLVSINATELNLRSTLQNLTNSTETLAHLDIRSVTGNMSVDSALALSQFRQH